MPINQLSTSNTFGQWLTATQALVEHANYFETSSNLVFDTANTVANISITISDTANAVYQVANDVSNTSNTVETTANSVFNYVAAAYDTANTVAIIAQNAYDTANATQLIEIIDETADTNAQYILFSANASGFLTEANISSPKLYFTPSTGQLSATNFDSLSDENKKTDIETIQNALDLVLMLRGVKFKWKENNIQSLGVIAQEVERIIPEVVITNERGEKSVIYGNMIGLLIESIKELKNEVDQIKNIINKE